jgi:hypothetical protein
VDADLDTLATALYVTIDDLLQQAPHLAPWRPRVGIAPKPSDAELVTPAAMQALRQNFASRSRSRNRIGRPRSPNTSRRLRACWVTHSPLGLAVTPARCTRRVSSSMTPAHTAA